MKTHQIIRRHLISQPSNTRTFPKGFYSGVGTSAYQVESAWNEDGKGESIWDTYTHTPGNIKNNDTGDVANDHYHRYKEDVAYIKIECSLVPRDRKAQRSGMNGDY
jgi:hypothetical protein